MIPAARSIALAIALAAGLASGLAAQTAQSLFATRSTPSPHSPHPVG